MSAARGLAVPILLLVIAPCAAEAAKRWQIDQFSASPVYYERFSPAHLYVDNLQTLPHGQLTLPTFGVESVEGFDWQSHSREDASWWIQVERMDYILPFIESADSAHHAFARRWIAGWLDVHEKNPTPTPGSYDEMGIGIRALVLVRYMKHLKLVEPDEVDLLNRIRRMLRWHLRYLEDPAHFNRNSNHGFWEALGLIEITRVIPDSAATMLGQRRLLSVVGRSVSPSGIHVERAAAYHFVFYEWVRTAAEYVDGLRQFPGKAGAVLSRQASLMRAASYFYYDHALRVPQIGDSDAMRAPEGVVAAHGSTTAEVLFDRVAGQAFFKDGMASPHRRYIVLGIPNVGHPLTMPFHSHNDALALYYSNDGEIILGDQGRFTYDAVPERDHYRSSAAHNAWVSAASLSHKQADTELAHAVWHRVGGDSVVFGGHLNVRNATREVALARRGDGGLSVNDELFDGGAGFLLWHIGPDVVTVETVSAASENGRQRLEWRLVTARGRVHVMTVEMIGGATLEVEEIRGDEERYLGWYSPRYREAESCLLLCVKVGAGTGRSVRTTLRPVTSAD